MSNDAEASKSPNVVIATGPPQCMCEADAGRTKLCSLATRATELPTNPLTLRPSKIRMDARPSPAIAHRVRMRPNVRHRLRATLARGVRKHDP
jgi:hypothetical protein